MSMPWACTTEGHKKRHYSVDLEQKPKRGPGRYGTTLCGEWAMDDAAMEGRPVADLPACKICLKRLVVDS